MDKKHTYSMKLYGYIKNLVIKIDKRMASVAIILILVCCASGWTLPKSEYSVTIDVGAKKYVISYPELDFYDGQYYVKNLSQVVDYIYYDSITMPVDAMAKLSGKKSGEFRYFEQKDGRAIDKEKLIKDVKECLRQKRTRLKATFVVKKAQITMADVRKQTLKRGGFSTYYGDSAEGRKHNVELASKTLNGYIIMPEEEFSFNEVVGRRTEERGYKTAKIITDGKFADGIGGGVCQVSTTLYNCALLSGLTVSEWHRHSLAVSYVEKGFDAMVNADVCDLKILNCTQSPIYIESFADGKVLTVNFYGVKNGYSYKRVSEISSVIKPEDAEIIYSDKMEEGKTEVIINPKDGYTSKSYLEVYKDGKLVERRQIRTDVYKSVRGVVEVGTFVGEA